MRRASAAHLLLAVDGRRDVGRIAAALLGDAAATDLVRAALTQLTQLGLVVWRAAWEEAM